MNSTIPHAKIKLATSGRQPNHDLVMHNGDFYTLSPGEVIGPLIRDFQVIRYCVSGHGTVRINNNPPFLVSPGQCYIGFAGDVMTETAHPDEEWSIAFLTLLGIKAPMYFKYLGISSACPVLPWAKNDKFLDLMKNAISYFLAHGTGHSDTFMYIAYAYAILGQLQKSLHRQQAPDSEEQMQEQYVNEAIRFMEHNCAGKLTVSDIAAHIGINRSYFYSLFKQYTGRSPQEHLTRLRIAKACELFAYPYSTVVNVANSLGLEASVFFRHFKRIMGITPTQYKQRLSGEAAARDPGDG